VAKQRNQDVVRLAKQPSFSQSWGDPNMKLGEGLWFVGYTSKQWVRPRLYVYPTEEIESLFRELSLRWKSETRFVSSAHTIFLNRAYQRIIGLGRAALPYLFSELEQRPDNWFWALESITGEDPAPLSTSFDERVNAWLSWGRLKGYHG